jgi:hypothetical protein
LYRIVLNISLLDLIKRNESDSVWNFFLLEYQGYAFLSYGIFCADVPIYVADSENSVGKRGIGKTSSKKKVFRLERAGAIMFL